ncbi:MAG TPA: exo-alpha-sialidase [Candidatus Hydrogenedentes bacterium]|nr:exo-alpha-sialidase [Candidatus Hydrogenedentota bacterium]HNT87924.1 exo-alpha-sialidase [Candidatus Hydrogenedentota bacterium]
MTLKYAIFTGVCCGVVMSGISTLGFAQEKRVVKQAPAQYASQAFEDRVREAGGRVDFVFGDERPFAQCHASTIVQAPSGELVCAWFGGTEEKNPDVGIWRSRFSEGAWSAPERAAKVNETAHWNPVLFRDKEGVVYLFFKVGPDTDYWQTYWMRSTDGGATWSESAELVAGDKGGRGPVKNKPIILSDGAWLAPASIEYAGWQPFADRSTDGGATWERSEYFAIDKTDKTLRGAGAIQPTFWESAPGTVHALLRSGSGRVWRADSEDGGKTWSPVRATELPNNNSGLDVILLEDGRLLLVYNPVGMNWGPRTPLTLAVSRDHGDTWENLAHLEDDPDLKSEYSYPSIVRTDTGVAISYTWNRQRVRVWQIPLAAL